MVTFLVTSLGDPTRLGSEGLELTPGEPVIGENFANSAGVLVKLEMFKHSFSYLPLSSVQICMSCYRSCYDISPY